MFKTKYGPFNGNTWEDLCQQIFKRKYAADGYQEMKASPGDYGIEGFTKATGIAFQCYCPDNLYTQGDLYEKQRDKITKDLKKLKKYEQQLKSRLGKTKIKEWVFVTPEANHNKLLEHAQTKQTEVIGWGLSIISDGLIVLIKDADFFATEINHFQVINGEKLIFDDQIQILPSYDKNDDLSEYEKNINRKNKKRCNHEDGKNSNKLKKLNDITTKNWLDGEGLIKKIESTAPQVYHHLVRVINQYEDEVSEISVTWTGTAEELTERVKDSLFQRLRDEIPDMSTTDHRLISSHMVAKWLAFCPLDFE